MGATETSARAGQERTIASGDGVLEIRRVKVYEMSESLALNFVGTSIRSCQDANLPNTCYVAGFVPYSIEPDGPFFVRNRAGDDYEALLFDGRIEHARGLALERYLSNPISSSDQRLINEYMRSEFSGRPLDGNSRCASGMITASTSLRLRTYS